jgi:hypothetical protein
MRLDEARLMINYFLTADHEYLRGMGVGQPAHVTCIRGQAFSEC